MSFTITKKMVNGNLIYIKYVPIGDVTFWQEDMPIVIGDKKYCGKGVGGKVKSNVSLILRRGNIPWSE